MVLQRTVTAAITPGAETSFDLFECSEILVVYILVYGRLNVLLVRIVDWCLKPLIHILITASQVFVDERVVQRRGSMLIGVIAGGENLYASRDCPFARLLDLNWLFLVNFL